MKYPMTIPGMEGQNVELAYNFWTGNRVLVNGEKAPRGKKPNQFLLKKNDGTEAIASLKMQVLGFDVPQLQVDEQVYAAVEPLKWYQIVWSILPVGLLFVGGFIGAMCGLFAFYANGRIFRSNMNEILKYIVTALISGAAVIVWLGISLAVQGMIQQ
jgi:hypothetical protein